MAENIREKLNQWSYVGAFAGTTEKSQDFSTLALPSIEENSQAEIGTAKPKTISEQSRFYTTIKSQLHQRLISRMDLAAAERMSSEQLRVQLGNLVNALVIEDSIPLNESEKKQIVVDLQNEILGLGPLEPLLADPSVTEILVNGFQSVFVEKKGRLQRVVTTFSDDAHLLKIIDKIVARVGRRIDESSPMADARLPDGARVNAIIPPLAIDGPSVSIRRFSVVPLQMKDLVEKQALTSDMARVLAGMVKSKCNILISGGTGSGKTTLLNVMSGYIPENERIITIEDTAELQLQQGHVVRLETRPPNIEGKGEITTRALVRNSLRMRPDRIVLGEVRSDEVIDMLQAMNTGHEGSLTTIHANTSRDALGRLENLVGLGGVQLPVKALRQQIVSAINVIVQVARFTDGSRRIIGIDEVTGMEGDMITMQEIFRFERTGTAPDGRVIGRFTATGVRPLLLSRMKAFGIEFEESVFTPEIAKE